MIEAQQFLYLRAYRPNGTPFRFLFRFRLLPLLTQWLDDSRFRLFHQLVVVVLFAVRVGIATVDVIFGLGVAEAVHTFAVLAPAYNVVRIVVDRSVRRRVVTTVAFNRSTSAAAGVTSFAPGVRFDRAGAS